jgi:hypothetical protein
MSAKLPQLCVVRGILAARVLYDPAHGALGDAGFLLDIRPALAPYGDKLIPDVAKFCLHRVADSQAFYGPCQGQRWPNRFGLCLAHA